MPRPRRGHRENAQRIRSGFGAIPYPYTKAVFAAIAFSFANRMIAKSQGTEIADCLLEEWRILYANGIVPQKPPKEART